MRLTATVVTNRGREDKVGGRMSRSCETNRRGGEPTVRAGELNRVEVRSSHFKSLQVTLVSVGKSL